MFLKGVVLNDLSDHPSVFAYFSGQTLKRDGDNKAFTRKSTDENLRKLLTYRQISQNGLQ